MKILDVITTNKPRLPLVVSYVFHPLVMPTLGVFFIFHSGTPISAIDTGAQWYIMAMVFAFTYLVPSVLLVSLYALRFIGHLEANERNERIFPVAVTAIIYYLSYSFLKQHDMLIFVALFILATVIVLIMLLVINFFWKISLHMAGAGGICGLTLFLATRISQANVMFLVVAIVIAGLVAHARLKLQEHNPAQVVAGFACGFIPVFSMFAWI